MSRTSTESTRQKVSRTPSSPRAATGKKRAAYSPKPGDGADRYQMVAIAAYYRAEHRGFTGGNPVDDWLAAETEIDRLYH
jgi:hypothetical protein